MPSGYAHLQFNGTLLACTSIQTASEAANKSWYPPASIHALASPVVRLWLLLQPNSCAPRRISTDFYASCAVHKIFCSGRLRSLTCGVEGIHRCPCIFANWSGWAKKIHPTGSRQFQIYAGAGGVMCHGLVLGRWLLVFYARARGKLE